MSKPPLSYPHINIVRGPQQGKIITIAKNRFVMGRDPKADLVVDSQYISRHHAEISLAGSRWVLTDLRSKNHVFHNRRKLESGEAVILKNGDRIQLGQIANLIFEDPGATVSDTLSDIPYPGLYIDRKNYEVYVNGCKLEPQLSKQLYIVLYTLYRRPGEVVTKEELGKAIWGDQYFNIDTLTESALDNAISRLRKRITALDDKHEYIRNVRGRGKKFVQRTN